MSDTTKEIDNKIITKSIPSTEGTDDPSNILEEHIWTSIYGDEDVDKDIRKHVVSYNGITK